MILKGFPLFISILLALVQAEEGTVRILEKHALARPNETVYFTCSTKSDLIGWMKDNSMPFAENDQVYSIFQDKYRVIKQQGYFKLEIRNVGLDDIGEYTCSDVKSRDYSSRRLTVIVPPTHTEFMKHPERATAVDVYAGMPSEFSCRASYSIPEAQIKWYLGNQLLDDSNSTVEIENISNNKHKNTTSTYTLLADKSWEISRKNELTCEISHPAMERSVRKSVFLRIKYAPDGPRIDSTTYQSGEIAAENSRIRFTCTASGGYPKPDLSWEIDGDNKIPRIDQSSPPGSTGAAAVKFLDLKMNRRHNQRKLRCLATNEVTEKQRRPVIADIPLNVAFPPDMVYLEGPRGGRVNDTMKYKCSTSLSNPESIIVWEFNGQTLEEENGEILKEMTDNVYGSKVSSELSIKLQEGSVTNKLKCIVRTPMPNTRAHQTAKEMVIGVYRAPSPPTIRRFGRKFDKPLLDGEAVTFQCETKNGSPTPSIWWLLNGERINGRLLSTTENQTSEISFQVRAEHNNKLLTCIVNSSAVHVAMNATQRLTVFYPPQSVTVQPEMETVLVNSTVRLRCQPEQSNPTPELRWFLNGRDITSKAISTNEVSKETAKLTYISHLRIEAKSEYDNQQIRCVAVSMHFPNRQPYDAVLLVKEGNAACGSVMTSPPCTQQMRFIKVPKINPAEVVQEDWKTTTLIIGIFMAVFLIVAIIFVSVCLARRTRQDKKKVNRLETNQHSCQSFGFGNGLKNHLRHDGRPNSGGSDRSGESSTSYPSDDTKTGAISDGSANYTEYNNIKATENAAIATRRNVLERYPKYPINNNSYGDAEYQKSYQKEATIPMQLSTSYSNLQNSQPSNERFSNPYGTTTRIVTNAHYGMAGNKRQIPYDSYEPARPGENDQVNSLSGTYHNSAILNTDNVYGHMRNDPISQHSRTPGIYHPIQHSSVYSSDGYYGNQPQSNYSMNTAYPVITYNADAPSYTVLPKIPQENGLPNVDSVASEELALSPLMTSNYGQTNHNLTTTFPAHSLSPNNSTSQSDYRYSSHAVSTSAGIHHIDPNDFDGQTGALV